MPRIISIEEGKLLDAYKATGLSPDEIEALYAKTADTEPPLPPLYRVCPHCGISLDIGERCRCERRYQHG